MDIGKIQWYGKSRFSQRARKTGNLDVTISKGMTLNKPKVRFTLRNSVYELITDTDRIQYGMPNSKRSNRIYFISGTAENGLKLSTTKNSNSETRYVAINKENEVERLIPFIGDYELSYDDECKLYYIER